MIYTVFTIRHLLWPDPAHTPVDLRREWAIIPLYLLPWIGWLFIIGLHRRHCARHRQYDRSVSASVAALLDEFIGGLLLACILMLPLMMLQLRAAGKAGDEIFLPFLVLFPSILGGIVIWMAFYYRGKLVPRRRELETLLQAYRETERDPGARA